MISKTYDKYKASGLSWGDRIPEEWQVCRNKHFLQEVNDHSESGTEELLTVSQYTGITKRRDRAEENELLTTAKTLEGYKKVQKEMLVMNIMLAWNGSLGVSDYDGIVSPAYCVYKINRSLVFPRFLHYLHRTRLYLGIFETVSTGVIKSRLRLYPEKYLALKSVLPPVSEQEMITKYLDWKTSQINKFIKAKKRMIELLHEQNDVYTLGRNKVHSFNINNSWENSFPSSWEMIKAKRVFCESKTKDAPDKDLLAVTQDRGVIRKKDCEQSYLSPSGNLNSLKLVQVHDFVISLRSFQGGIEHSNCEGIVSPAYNVIRLKAEFNCLEYIRYYKYLFKTQSFISLLNTIVSGIRDGKNINYTDFSEIIIPVPPKNEIKNMFIFFDKYENCVNLFLKERSRIYEYRDRLIADVVTGKVDVRDIIVPQYKTDDISNDLENSIEIELEEDVLTNEN